MEYIIDGNGKWEDYGTYKILIEPSEEYIKYQTLMDQQRLEQELLDRLKPSEKEVLMAEVELNTINLLLELEVI